MLFSGFYFLSQERRAQRSGVSLEERLEHAERQQLSESREEWIYKDHNFSVLKLKREVLA